MATGRSAALPASSASLSVPLSQNTAPVIKFQCLFTHDIRRKAKRWQDGFLRFHTFNKRIMVYDVSGNFTGDLHWQTDTELQDGDELELEQGGVLVQVGECLERTQTDLTPLLEKRKATATTTTTTTMRTAASLPRPANAYSPQSSRQPASSGSLVRYPANRLKPLTEVLGMARAPAVRTPLPAKSLDDKIHGSREDDRTERPAKRYKRSRDHNEGGGENTGPSHAAAAPSEAPNRPASRGNSERITLPSRGSAATTISRPSEPNPSGVLSFQPASTVSDTESSSKSRRKSPDKESSEQQRSIADVFAVDNSANSLHFPTQKPRNKLVCRGLLSASASNESENQQKEPVGAHKISDRPKSSKINNELRAAESRSGNGNYASNVAKSSVLTPTDGNNTLAFVPSVSTLQALEETAAPASSQKDAMISDFFKSSRPGPRQNSAGDETAGDENLYSQTSAIPHPPRSLTRSHSDMIPEPGAPTTISNDAPVLPPEENPQQQRSLQKSHSDLSSLRTNSNTSGPSAARGFQTKLAPMMMTTANGNLSSAIDDDRERGPWTSEALDLFDWWPPRRQKPAPNADETGAC